MRLLTWNLNRKGTALARALAHLERVAKLDSVVACLQDIPKSPLLTSISTGVTTVSPTLRAVPVACPARVALVHSDDLVVRRCAPGGSGRTVFAELATPSGSIVQVVGLHANDRIFWGNAEERGGRAASFRREIDDLTNAALPIVVLGDFNADVAAEEIGKRSCFYAINQATLRRVQDLSNSHFGRDSRPLFVVAPKGVPRGTLFLRWGDDRRWQTYDFAAVDELLVSRVKRCTVLDAIDGISLLGPRAETPNKAKYSDHLPVELALDFH